MMDQFRRALAANAPDNSWTEDFPHENGMYNCVCSRCAETFMGHKRRNVCKKCATPIAAPRTNTIEMFYTNYRGETSRRTILPIGIRWGTSEWHPEPCWLLLAFDCGKGENREFALRDADFADAVIAEVTG